MTVHAVINLNTPTLVTYPRSGLHFFVTSFFEATGIMIESGHEINLNNTDRVITIVRNPLDSFASYHAMDKNHGDARSDDEYLHVYKKTYSWLISNAKIVIDFNTMERNINPILQKVCDSYGIEKINTVHAEKILSSLSKNNGKLSDYVLDSSRRLDIYQKSREYWEQKNLSTQSYLYERLKERAILQ